MIPCIPNKKVGIGHADISLLRETFGITETFKIEKIIEKAITAKAWNDGGFTENAKEETYRLRKSGMPVLPIDITLEETLIKSLTSIDGALICDIKGICYSIGVILDGETSDKADLSRGARYNSAIRYIEQQRKNDKKTGDVDPKKGIHGGKIKICHGVYKRHGGVCIPGISGNHGSHYFE